MAQGVARGVAFARRRTVLMTPSDLFQNRAGAGGWLVVFQIKTYCTAEIRRLIPRAAE